jgi:hypothetical protein
MRGKLSLEEKMINALKKRKRAYEKYFRTLKDVDNQAQSAYTSIIKTIVELSRKIPAGVSDPEEMKRRLDEVLETEYGIKRR